MPSITLIFMYVFVLLICFASFCLVAVLNAKKATAQKKKNTPRKPTSNMPSSSSSTPTSSTTTVKDDSHATEVEEAPLTNGNVDSHNSSQYVSGDTLQQEQKKKNCITYFPSITRDLSRINAMFPFWAFDTIIDLSKSTTIPRRTMRTHTHCTRMRKKTWRTTGEAATTTSQSEMCFTKVAMSLSASLAGDTSRLFGWQETLCKYHFLGMTCTFFGILGSFIETV